MLNYELLFCIFALEQEKNIMAKLNRIRIVLAELDLNNKWFATSFVTSLVPCSVPSLSPVDE